MRVTYDDTPDPELPRPSWQPCLYHCGARSLLRQRPLFDLGGPREPPRPVRDDQPALPLEDASGERAASD